MAKQENTLHLLTRRQGWFADACNGVCCSCGFSGEEEVVCPVRTDGVHCVHWYEGPDGDRKNEDS